MSWSTTPAQACDVNAATLSLTAARDAAVAKVAADAALGARVEAVIDRAGTLSSARHRQVMHAAAAVLWVCAALVAGATVVALGQLQWFGPVSLQSYIAGAVLATTLAWAIAFTAARCTNAVEIHDRDRAVARAAARTMFARGCGEDAVIEMLLRAERDQLDVPELAAAIVTA